MVMMNMPKPKPETRCTKAAPTDIRKIRDITGRLMTGRNVFADSVADLQVLTLQIYFFFTI